MKKSEANNAKMLEEWRKLQESTSMKFESSIDGSQIQEKEAKLNRIRERESDLVALRKSVEAKRSGQGSSAEAFLHIKRATGVNSWAEIVEKFANHNEHSIRLQREKKEAEERQA